MPASFNARSFRLKSSIASGIAFGVLLASQAFAAPTVYTRPNVVTDAGATSVTLNGKTFVNHGLQGVARLSATSTLDFNGDTFGAFSGLDVAPGSWRKTASGYTGTLFSLPDRGPNGVGSVTFSDYAGRVSSFSMNFTPYTSTTNLPVSADSQQQLKLTQTGGFFFKDFAGKVTTGLDPGTGDTAFVTQSGKSLPGSTTGPAAGKISLDAEGLRFLNNGNFYVSDEYGANVYYFDKTGAMLGVIQPPAALTPRTATGLSYTSLSDATTGRRLNQGLEGMAVTPDNKKLVTLLQSAAMQDSTTAQQTRTNTRLMIYDISQNKTPGAPVADYVLQLPTFTANGDGAAVNRTAAQSELLALNDTQFLVLSRDGNGLGQALLNPVYKSVLLIDTTGATNIAGTTYETTTTPIATNGVLNAAINPVSQVEVVNILNTTQLNKFGINTNNTAPNRLTLTEKWEGMALVPALDEAAPQDYFLLVGNDNDFLSSNCKVGGQDCAQAVNSDAVVLMYRLTLPTYVDSQYLLAMQETAPATIGMTTMAAHEMAIANADDITTHFIGLRHGAADGVSATGSTFAVWGAGDVARRSQDGNRVGARTNGGTIGFDAVMNSYVTVGAALGYYQGEFDADAALVGGDYENNAISFYGSFRSGRGYMNLIGSHGDIDFTSIQRPGAYGMSATGDTGGSSNALMAEGGFLFESGNFRYGPVAGFRWVDTEISAYVETAAAGGNIAYPEVETDGIGGFVGGEVSMQIAGVRSILRVVYNGEADNDTLTADASLANSTSVMGTQSVVIDNLVESSIEPSITIAGQQQGQWDWWLNYGAKIGQDAGPDHRVSAGVRFLF
ncbi:MAG: esterase-like activity of phytase family protein [Pseudomonadota bacterium]